MQVAKGIWEQRKTFKFKFHKPEVGSYLSRKIFLDVLLLNSRTELHMRKL